MTDSPSDAPATRGNGGSVAALAARVAAAAGSAEWTADHDTVLVYVEPDRWVEAVTAVRDEGLPLFSWLSAVDWSRDVAVGEQVEDPESLEERFEVIVRLSSVKSADGAHVITRLAKDRPVIDSLVPVFAGAEWHEREAAEMFGITFTGHPNLVHLYLPDAFEGHPGLKSYPLLAREVKPWPGTVDVEGMPSTGNEEAGDSGDAGDAGGDGE